MTGLVLAAALAAPGPPVHLDVVLKDADVAQVASLLSLPAWLRPKLVGRVGLVKISVRGERFELAATHWRVPGDPVTRLTAVGDWRARTVHVKVEALGGLVEYLGRLP
jgi:hypothetical protein